MVQSGIPAALANVCFGGQSERAARRVYEYTPFCNGPVDVKRPHDRHVAELTLLSVVNAEVATLCC